MEIIEGLALLLSLAVIYKVGKIKGSISVFNALSIDNNNNKEKKIKPLTIGDLIENKQREAIDLTNCLSSTMNRQELMTFKNENLEWMFVEFCDELMQKLESLKLEISILKKHEH